MAHDSILSHEALRETPLQRHLSTDGDGGGTINFVGNYSSAPVRAFAKVPAGEVWVINKFVTVVEDSGTFDSGKYGNNITLTNGIVLRYLDAEGNVVVDFTDGEPILTNGMWAHLACELKHYNFGSGNEFLAARINFGQCFGSIVMTAGESIEVVLNDNFSGLETHHDFIIQGYIENHRP